MEKREFHNMEEFDSVKDQLATAIQCPVYIDQNGEYEQFDMSSDEDVIQPRTLEEGHTLGEVRNRNAIWNVRDSELSYFGSEQYKLVQHDTILDAVKEAVNQADTGVEMGVIKDYGSQIDGTLVLNDENALINVEDIVDTDDYIPPEGDVDPRGGSRARDTLGLGMRLGNSFDGRKKIYFSTMGYRFICQNWMVWGEEEIAQTEAFHLEELSEGEPSDNLEDMVDLILETFEDVFEIRDRVTGIVGDSESEEIPFEWVPGILEDAGFGTNYAKKITGNVLRQHTPRDGYTTSWRIYNAATREIDHGKGRDIGLWSYNKYQKSAWDLLGEPEEPEEEMDLEELELEYAVFDE